MIILIRNGNSKNHNSNSNNQNSNSINNRNDNSKSDSDNTNTQNVNLEGSQQFLGEEGGFRPGLITCLEPRWAARWSAVTPSLPDAFGSALR